MVIAVDEVIDVDDGRDSSGPNYLWLASRLQQRLQDGQAGMGDGDPELTEILQFAAPEFGIESDDHANERREESRGEGMHSNTCRHFCCDHKEIMNPKLWGELPLGLLEMVFAYLPVGEICRLRLLSKKWKQTLETPDCEFYKVCERVGRKMLCFITRSDNLFWARVLNTESRKWCTYQINALHSVNLPFHGTNGTAPASSDAGFVLFTTRINSWSKRRESRPSLLISIVNPLTRIVDELPTLFDLWSMEIVQLKMDGSSTVFKVFLVAAGAQWTRDKGPPSWTIAGIALHIFDSLTREWTTAHDTPHLVFGHRKWMSESDIAYDSADGGQLLDLRGSGLRTWTTESYTARYQDRLFVMYMEYEVRECHLDGALGCPSGACYIQEFVFRKQGERLSWVKTDIHRCNPSERHLSFFPRYFRFLFSCDGFLVMTSSLEETADCAGSLERLFALDRIRREDCNSSIRFNNQLAWLYDLSTRTWNTLDLPQLPAGRRTYSEDGKELIVELPGGLKRRMKYDGDTQIVDLMCEPHWTV